MEAGAALGATRQIVCIADLDADAVLGRRHESPCLLLTDYSDIELYAFNSETVGKYFRVVCGQVVEDIEEVLNDFTDILGSLFLVHTASHKLSLGLQDVDFLPDCEVSGQRVQFDVETYLDRYATRRPRKETRAAIEAEVAKLRDKQPTDRRQRIRGADFITLLGYYAGRRFKDRSIARGPRSPERSLLGCVELRQLEEETLFRALRERLK